MLRASAVAGSRGNGWTFTVSLASSSGPLALVTRSRHVLAPTGGVTVIDPCAATEAWQMHCRA